MRRISVLGVPIALVLAGCGVTPDNPAAPSLMTNSAAQAVGSADDPGAPHIASAPAAEAPQLNVVDSNQSVSFEAALSAASLRSGAVRVRADEQSSQLTLSDGIQSALVAGAGARHDGGVVSSPSLDQPTVDTSGRRVTVSWHPGGVGTPTRWILNYTIPTGGGGSIEFPGAQTSITANLPLEGGYTVRARACDAAGCSDFSPTRSFELKSAGAPGQPASCSATANGLVVTLSWGPPAANTGGPVTTYVVLYEGREYPVGLATSVSGTVPPGRRLFSVFARNAYGRSAAASCEVTVGSSGQGTYVGTYNRTGTITRSFSDGTCTWPITFSGTVTLALTQGTGGMTGTIRVNGAWSVPEGTPSGSMTCFSGSGSYDSTHPVIVSGTNIARTGIDMDLATGSFSGSLSGTTVTGNLTAAYSYGSGTVTIPVTLNKQ